MKPKKSWLCILMSMTMLLASPALASYGAEAAEADNGQVQAPYLWIDSEDASVDSFPLKETSVNTNINGVIAETYVTQVYTNQGEVPVNASYIFPASDSVTIHGMTMQIGSQLVTAQIKEKEEAKEEFETAKEEGKSASLLEQKRPNVFSMDVANIMPGDEVRIELHYTEQITPREGTYQFVFPTVAGPRFVAPEEDKESETSNQWAVSPYYKEGTVEDGKYDIQVNLSMGVPISSLECKSHEIVNEAEPGAATAKVTLAHPEQFAGNRDFILEYRLTGEEVSCGLVLDEGEEENYFMLMVQPPERVQPEEIMPREYLFVLDVSGSMMGYPLDTAKEMIGDLVSGLKETDRFNVILFSNEFHKLSGKSLDATQKNIQDALDFIDEQTGGGGTMLAPALRGALAVPAVEDSARNVIIITDGYLTDEKEVFGIISENINNTSFFAFGIGSSVNRYLIDGIAKTGMGEEFVVTDSEDAKEAAEYFRTYVEAPLLTDIQVEYEGFEAYDTEPGQIPVLFAQRPIVLFGKWKGDPAGTIRLTGKAGGQDYEQEIPVTGEAVKEDAGAIRYLWARTRVEMLTDYGNNKGDDPDVKKEITDIGLKYSMMTPYTSFVAVLDIVRNENGDSADVDQPLPLPSGVSENALGVSVSNGGYTTGSEPGEIALLLMLAAVMCLPLLRRARIQKRRMM